MIAPLLLGLLGASSAPVPDRAPLELRSPVRDKNFYLLALLERSPEALAAMRTDPTLRRVGEAARARLAASVHPKDLDVVATTNALRMPPGDVEAAAEALRSLYRTNPAMRRLVDGSLRRSGVAVRDGDLDGGEALARAWHDAAKGLDNVVEVYAQAKPSRYPLIDSMIYEPGDRFFGQLLQVRLALRAEDAKPTDPFFGPNLDLAIDLLEVNQRDEAGRFEPMERGENRKACAQVRKVDWAKYPYSVILVPGHGPEDPRQSLSSMGALVVEAAAKRYRAGKAPFILVSGGYVHPNRTPFCEAIEMKKALMARWGVPESAILVDPHARHTTTNFRNAARLIYRYGLPFEKTALCVANPYQNDTIASASFVRRCQAELGGQPARGYKRVDPFEVEFRPQIDALQTDPTDPLDP